MVKAVPRQMFARITAGIGNEPIQSTGPNPSELRKTWFSEPKKKSYIATQRKPAMSAGLTHASRTAPYARAPSHQPRCSAWSIRSARARPRTNCPITAEPTTNTTEFLITVQKSGSAKSRA